jgi:hypothetical protein
MDYQCAGAMILIFGLVPSLAWLFGILPALGVSVASLVVLCLIIAFEREDRSPHLPDGG